MFWSLFISYIFAPSVIMTQLRGLDCLTLESSGLRYLRVDTRIECDLDDPDYALLLAFDLPLIALYQAVPLMYFIQLYRNRDRLNPTLYGRDYKDLPPGACIRACMCVRKLAHVRTHVHTHTHMHTRAYQRKSIS